MKYHIVQKCRTAIAVVVVMIVSALSVSAQVPAAPNPPRLVNDFASLFTAEQVKELEDSLESFSKRTSNQIAVVTMDDLGGVTSAEMAFGIGDKWGVGGKEFNNGVVILVKPKNSTRGQAFIATGYGVEGVLPDAISKRIVEDEMIPHFRENNYYDGVEAALAVVKPLVAKEYTVEEYEKSQEMPTWAAILVLLLAVAMVIMIIKASKNGGNNGNNDAGTIGGGGIFLGGFPFGGGSSSSGFGGGGGFGGFGGGSFGGGGAGGSW